MEEKNLIRTLKKQNPDIKIMNTDEYRERIRKGLSTDGYNFHMAGKMGYAYTRLVYNAVLLLEDEEGDPSNVVKEGHPLPGVYKIAEIKGSNDKRAINREGHGYHHSNQILTCYYSKASTTNFVTEETVDVFAYPLWQSVAARDVDRLDIGDVFEVISFDLIDTPYSCYRLQWHLVSKSSHKSSIYSCATEGDCLPRVNTSKTLISELRRVRDKIAQDKELDSYKIFPNKTLESLANKKPQTFSELLSIPGIGSYKMNAYGGWILYVIKCFKDRSKNNKKTFSSSNTSNLKQKSLETLLIEYRTNQAKQEMVPAYCVFSNAVIQSIIEAKPKTRRDLLAIHGFGLVKYEKYGEDIIRLVKQQNKSVSKGETVTTTVEMYYEGMSPDEIANERNLSIQTIYTHLFKANIIDPHDILSNYQYDQSYTFWLNSRVDMILEVYGDIGVAAFYYIKNNNLY